MTGALTGWLWVIIPAAAIGLFIAAAADSLLRHTGRMSAGQLLFRVLTGDHLDAKLRNNRTWTKPATRPLHRPVDWHMSWWSRQPRIKRAAPAWLLLVGLPAAAYGLLAAAALTAALLAAAALTATAWGILTAARWLARRHHRTHVVRPLATALAGQLKQHQAVTAASLKVRPRLDTCRPGDDVLRIDGIPDHYAAQDRERKFVENLIRARVPVDLDFDWQTHRHPMRLVGRCSAAPPLAVTAADWLPVIDSLSPSQYFLGVSANEHPEIWDASEEDPNAMVGGKTRRGKTNLNLGVAAQALRRGEQVTAIDHKRVSLRCLTGVPGFTLANDPSDVDAMWAAIHQFRAAMDTTIAGHGDGTPHTLILEEIPQLYRLFHDHWSLTRPRGGLVTNMPPARDIAAILNQGAQFGFRVLLGGQDLKDQLLFGYRHAFGLALMAGYTPAQWAYTIGTKPAPIPPARRGRFYLARAGAHTPTLLQIVCADPRGETRNEQAWRHFALNGRTPDTGWAPRWTPSWRTPRRPRPTPRTALPWTDRKALPALVMGPKQAAAYLGMTENAFKMARRRNPIPGEFQDRIRGRLTSCWTRETLNLWAATLPRTTTSRP